MRFERETIDSMPSANDDNFGHLPGIALRSTFRSRRELYDAGVHRQLQAGIVGTRMRGAESIVMSGGYPDDEDSGFEIKYTGHGGQDPATKKQVRDQDPDDSGNAALIKSVETGRPIRVVRGSGHKSPHAPKSGFRYDGLYVVTGHSTAEGREGYQMCFFTLMCVDLSDDLAGEIDVEADAATSAAPAGSLTPGRTTRVSTGPTRSAAVVGWVKNLHNYTCQMCGVRITLRGMPHAHGAHIRPLDSVHLGPDVLENVLCLCPNCHVQYDHGEIRINQDFRVTGGLVGSAALRRVDAHAIDRVQIAYHDQIHFPSTAAGVRSS